jgi:hypothetical protein
MVFHFKVKIDATVFYEPVYRWGARFVACKAKIALVVWIAFTELIAVEYGNDFVHIVNHVLINYWVTHW